MFELGVPMKDKVSGLAGVLTHMQVYSPTARMYNFQPAGLNKEGLPMARRWIHDARIEGVEVADVNIPWDAIGTEVWDTVTTFAGKLTAFVVHMNGCIHAEITPPGTNSETGGLFGSYDFDMRLLKGDALPPLLTKAELAKSQEKTPSPDETLPFELLGM